MLRLVAVAAVLALLAPHDLRDVGGLVVGEVKAVGVGLFKHLGGPQERCVDVLGHESLT